MAKFFETSSLVELLKIYRSDLLKRGDYVVTNLPWIVHWRSYLTSLLFKSSKIGDRYTNVTSFNSECLVKQVKSSHSSNTWTTTNINTNSQERRTSSSYCDTNSLMAMNHTLS